MLEDVDLTVEQGEVVVIIGSSVVGKSTFLRSLSRLEKITNGRIFIEDELFYHRENDKTVEKWRLKRISSFFWRWERCSRGSNSGERRSRGDIYKSAVARGKAVFKEYFVRQSSGYE